MKTSTYTGNILVVIEQKGSDAEECRERFMAGCELFKTLHAEVSAGSSQACRLLIVGGANNGNSPETIRSWCPEDLLDILVISNQAGNTHEKAVSILEFIQANSINTVIQVTSLYHSLRAYLTTLRSIKEQVPNVVFKNYVSDSKALATVQFAVSDEMFLAKAIDDRIGFTIDNDSLESYLQKAGAATNDPGLAKYLGKRYGEASRIVEYSECGKDHVTTNVALSTILDSYIVG